MASSDCTSSATATFYSTATSVITSTGLTTDYTTFSTGTGASVSSNVHTTTQLSTSTQLIPISTQYATDCTSNDDNGNGSSNNGNDNNTGTSPGSTASAPTPVVTAVTLSGSQDSNGQTVGPSVVLQTVFAGQNATKIVIETSSPSSTSDPIPSNGSDSDNGGTNVGAIAGGIVGGVIGLLFLALLAWWLKKRVRKAKDSRNLDDFFKDPTLGSSAAAANGGGASKKHKRTNSRNNLGDDVYGDDGMNEEELNYDGQQQEKDDEIRHQSNYPQQGGGYGGNGWTSMAESNGVASQRSAISQAKESGNVGRGAHGTIEANQRRLGVFPASNQGEVESAEATAPVLNRNGSNTSSSTATSQACPSTPRAAFSSDPRALSPSFTSQLLAPSSIPLSARPSPPESAMDQQLAPRSRPSSPLASSPAARNMLGMPCSNEGEGEDRWSAHDTPASATSTMASHQFWQVPASHSNPSSAPTSLSRKSSQRPFRKSVASPLALSAAQSQFPDQSVAATERNWSVSGPPRPKSAQGLSSALVQSLSPHNSPPQSPRFGNEKCLQPSPSMGPQKQMASSPPSPFYSAEYPPSRYGHLDRWRADDRQQRASFQQDQRRPMSRPMSRPVSSEDSQSREKQRQSSMQRNLSGPVQSLEIPIASFSTNQSTPSTAKSSASDTPFTPSPGATEISRTSGTDNVVLIDGNGKVMGVREEMGEDEEEAQHWLKPARKSADPTALQAYHRVMAQQSQDKAHEAGAAVHSTNTLQQKMEKEEEKKSDHDDDQLSARLWGQATTLFLVNS